MDNGSVTLKSRHRRTDLDRIPEGMRRIRMQVGYDGTEYAGWQRQENAMSVQQCVEEALASLTGEPISVIGSSRTDAGVHAEGLVCHFDTGSRIPPEKFSFALNTRLPESIRVMESGLAPDAFHARYSACAKSYRYLFYNGPHMCAIGRQYRMHVPLHMETDRMRQAAISLVGTHNFAAYMAAGSAAKSTVRTIYWADVWRQGDEVGIRVIGDGFLYNMVRIIAGTLAEIGTGKRDSSCVAEALETGDRLKLGATAEARGLVLERVFYEGDEQMLRRYMTPMCE